MNKFSFYKPFLILVLFFSVWSCSKQADLGTPEFKIKDMDGKEIQYLDPSILKSIHQDLISKGRIADAGTLLQKYNEETGVLKGAANVQITKFVNVPIDSALIPVRKDTVPDNQKSVIFQPNAVWAFAHVQNLGDTGPKYQAPFGMMFDNINTTNPAYIVGTTGQSLRLEGTWINTSISTSNRPTLYYALRFPAGQWTNDGGATPQSWGQFCGNRGTSQATSGIKIWTTTPGYHVYYITHIAGIGWLSSWSSDGAFSGFLGLRLEAFAFRILQY
jgi:hypothetical protein